jgi:UDP-N-acetylmuramoyl-tripeptide--D-alanyl-D-alanine ligase
MLDATDIYALFRQHPHVCTDPCSASEGCLFFAKNKIDAAQALEKGAAWAITDDPALAHTDRCFAVPSVSGALHALVARHRRQFAIPVIAVIETEENRLASSLIASVMSAHYACHFDQIDENEAPLLGLNDKMEVAVVSCRARQPDELRTLLSTIMPTHSILPHLSGEENGAGEVMLDHFSRHHGCAFVDLSASLAPQFLDNLRMCVGYKRIQELRPEPGIIEMTIEELPHSIQAAFLSDDGPKVEFNVSLPPVPANVRAVMAAIAVGVYFKVPVRGLEV